MQRLFKYAALLCIATTTFSCIDNSNTPAVTPTATVANNSDANRTKDTIIHQRVIHVTDPFRDINRFDIAVGNDFIDSLYRAFLNNTDTTGEYDLCLGDGCSSYKKTENRDEHTILYMVKGDASEYGFGNDQFFLKNDSLYFTRNFNVNVEEYPSDTVDTKWRIEETVYWFKGDSVTCYIRTAFTRKLNGFDFTLKNITPVLIPANMKKAYADQAERLDQIITLKERVEAD